MTSRRKVIPHKATACDSGSDMKMAKARGCGMRMSQLFCRLRVDLHGSHGALHRSSLTEKLVATNPEESEWMLHDAFNWIQLVVCFLTSIVSGSNAHGQHANGAHGKHALLNSLQPANVNVSLAALQICSRGGGGLPD